MTSELLRDATSLDVREARAVLGRLAGLGLLRPIGRGGGTKYSLHEIARRTSPYVDRGERVNAVVEYARRVGPIANRDVRHLLGVESATARETLDDGVALGLLTAVGDRRARVYRPA